MATQIHSTNGGPASPFRQDAADLVAMFQTIDAGTPAWHRARAQSLMRDARLQPVAAVTHAWSRLAARHFATAQLLEQQQQQALPRVDPEARHLRFRRQR